MKRKAKVHDPAVLTHEMIAVRAYHRFLNRSGEHGRDLDDWLSAEADLREELGIPASDEPSSELSSGRASL